MSALKFLGRGALIALGIYAIASWMADKDSEVYRKCLAVVSPGTDPTEAKGYTRSRCWAEQERYDQQNR